jgi:hypothetical protein
VWNELLGPNKSGYIETTEVSSMVVHPNGTLFVSATDETLRALRPDNGETVWKREFALVGNQLYSPRFGVGNRLVAGGRVFDPDTGAEVSHPSVGGLDIYSLGTPAYSHRLTAAAEKYAPGYWREVVLDECGNLQWSLPEFTVLVNLIGFDDDLLVLSRYGRDTPADRYVLHRYSIEGALLAGPADGFPVFNILGADGVFYVGYCVDQPGHLNDDADNLELVALSPSLEVLDRLYLGPFCHSVSAVLLDDGLLLVMRTGPTRTEILRIATASPGLAHTAWPTRDRDNARTGWVAPW